MDDDYIRDVQCEEVEWDGDLPEDNDGTYEWDDDPEYREDQFMDDVEADADVLRSAGWGTDEDYGFYGDDLDY